MSDPTFSPCCNKYSMPVVAQHPTDWRCVKCGSVFSVEPDELTALRRSHERLREALLNVSVHSAHNPDASRELLIELLAKCGTIARGALEESSL